MRARASPSQAYNTYKKHGGSRGMLEATSRRSGAFVCPGCVEHGLVKARPNRIGVDLGCIRYCELCASELLDEVTISVHDAAAAGHVRFTHHGDLHSIRVRMAGTMHVLITLCSCREARVVREYYPSFSQFWDSLNQFVRDHYESITTSVSWHETVPSRSHATLRPNVPRDAPLLLSPPPSFPQRRRHGFQQVDRNGTGPNSTRTRFLNVMGGVKPRRWQLQLYGKGKR